MAAQMTLAERMTGMAPALVEKSAGERGAVLRRSAIVAVIAFLTLIDLFGSQALLPTLVKVYGVSEASMGFAVNASTIGMAVASLGVAVYAGRIDRRQGIWISLALLSIPTALLGLAQDLTTFTALRVLQGVFMATAFTLTITYLSERCSVTALGGAMAAYITGNVASNLVGRLLATGVADTVGLSESFFAFAALNLVGAAVAWYYFRPGGGEPDLPGQTGVAVFDAWRAHLADPRLRATLMIGFSLLFCFVATFSYANFVIATAPFDLAPMYVGLVYFTFIPSMLTTPVAAAAVSRYGVRVSFFGAMAVSIVGLLLLLASNLTLFLTGLAFVGAGLFFAQSVATAYVGRTATRDRAAANGLYLASYYSGGLAGALVVGIVFEAAGWDAAVLVLIALAAATAVLGRRMIS